MSQSTVKCQIFVVHMSLSETSTVPVVHVVVAVVVVAAIVVVVVEVVVVAVVVEMPGNR